MGCVFYSAISYVNGLRQQNEVLAATNSEKQVQIDALTSHTEKLQSDNQVKGWEIGEQRQSIQLLNDTLAKERSVIEAQSRDIEKLISTVLEVQSTIREQSRAVTNLQVQLEKQHHHLQQRPSHNNVGYRFFKLSLGPFSISI